MGGNAIVEVLAPWGKHALFSLWAGALGYGVVDGVGCGLAVCGWGREGEDVGGGEMGGWGSRGEVMGLGGWEACGVGRGEGGHLRGGGVYLGIGGGILGMG